jgi:4-aminobutyrate aminotransferase
MKFKDYKEYLNPVLAKATDLVVESGEGCYLTDVNGEKYLDFVQGIAVNAMGHSHPSVVKAICEQSKKLINASFNLVNFPTTLELAKRICEIAPDDLGSVFFSNGGAEANDGAIKLAKSYTKRPAIIAFKGSFHGRTIGTTSITGSNSKYRKYYESSFGSAVYFVPYPSKDMCPKGFDEDQRTEFCLNELENTFKYLVSPDRVAGIIIEPVQGEGGYVVPQKAFIQGLRKICDKHGIILIFDEIQAGYGRTGKMFACENFDVVPDVVTLGKAIAGGMPMSAILCKPKFAETWAPGTHGTTFGGNPVVAAAALAVLDGFEKYNILENCNEKGGYLKEKLLKLKEKYEIISDVRGLGLMLAVEFTELDGTPGTAILTKLKEICYENKMLTLSCGVNANVMRFATPLNISFEDLDKGYEIFENAVKEISEGV